MPTNSKAKKSTMDRGIILELHKFKIKKTTNSNQITKRKLEMSKERRRKEKLIQKRVSVFRSKPGSGFLAVLRRSLFLSLKLI